MVAPTGDDNSTVKEQSCCGSSPDGEHNCCNDALDTEAAARAQNSTNPLPTLCENESFLGDIEDLVLDPDFDVAGGEGRRNRSFVVPRVSRRHQRRMEKRKTNQEQEQEVVEQQQSQPAIESIIPGTQKIFLKTWGCSHNSSDSEYMAGQLAAYGYQICDDRHAADLWLLNSCTVKNPAEDHFRNEVKAARAAGKYIVVAGCVPQGQPKTDYIQGVSVIGVQQIDRVVEVVEETLKGHSVRLLGKKKAEGRKVGGASLSLPKIRRNPLIEIIAINTGCLNQCTYCKTKHARGELGSYPPEEIVTRACQSFEEGVVEIWLTSEDLGAYGRDIGVTLPELLWKLAEVIPEGCMMRLGMTNPPYIMEHLEEIAQLLNHDRIYSFLHVPVQSGSDSVLMDMRREYCQADFRRVVEFLRDRVPDVTVATDVICGFPTETNEDFDDTLQLVRDYKFPSLFINQFFPRPGTPAAKMTKVPAKEVKRRTRLISDLFASYKPYDHKVGRVESVLITEISTDGKYYVGHNKAYDQVLVAMDRDYMGKMINVRITYAGKHYMMCEVLSEDSPAVLASDSFAPASATSLVPAAMGSFTKASTNSSTPVSTASPVSTKDAAAEQLKAAAVEGSETGSASQSEKEARNTAAAAAKRRVTIEPAAVAREEERREKSDGASDVGDRLLHATFYVLLSAVALRLTWLYFKR